MLFCHLLIFFQNQLYRKNTIRLSNSLDPDQARPRSNLFASVISRYIPETKLCAKDAECAGNKITERRTELGVLRLKDVCFGAPKMSCVPFMLQF